MAILVERPTKDRLRELGVDTWSPWECEVSRFSWTYEEREMAYVLAGRVRITTATETVEIAKGDLVTFPQGLMCTWDVIEPIKKVYLFV